MIRMPWSYTRLQVTITNNENTLPYANNSIVKSYFAILLPEWINRRVFNNRFLCPPWITLQIPPGLSFFHKSKNDRKCNISNDE